MACRYWVYSNTLVECTASVYTATYLTQYMRRFTRKPNIEDCVKYRPDHLQHAAQAKPDNHFKVSPPVDNVTLYP